MRYFIILLGILITLSCKAQNVNIVSPWLKARILATNTTTDLRAKDIDGNWLKIDQNNDGEIQVSEALNVKEYVDANGGYIATYDGMNSFINLQRLSFAYNQTPAGLNLSGLSNLKYLNCYMNSLTSLNLNGCNSLEDIYLDQNYLTTLDVSGISTLKQLNCQNNDLTSINLNSTPSLINILCFSNNITSLNLDNHANLEVLNCSGNSLTNLTFNNCPSLTLLSCDSNNLQTLDVNSSTNLIEIYCGYNHLQNLNVSNCLLLNHLDCVNNNLINLNINNGFNWIPSYDYTGSFRGYQNSSISQVCTSTDSVANILSYYSSFTSNVSNCTVLNLNENEITKILFYPNPATDKIRFVDVIELITIYDLKGILVKKDNLNTREMDISELSAGLYILKIQFKGKTTFGKLIIQ